MRASIQTVILTALLAPPALFASSAASDPAGFTRQTLRPGTQTTGVTLTHPALASAAIVDNEGGFLRLDPAAGPIGAMLEPNRAYYVEIAGAASAAFAGDRLAIDVVATRALGGSTLVIDRASNLTTMVAAPAGGLAGHRAVVRPHVTIADAFGPASQCLLHPAATPESADQMLLFERATGGFQTYYPHRDPRGGTSEWRRVGAIGRMDDSIIPPGAGLFVHRRANQETDFVMLGSVRTQDFIMPLEAGYNFVASPYPAARALSGIHLTSANGFRAAEHPDEADQILVFNGTGYDTFYLHRHSDSSAEEWRREGGGDVIRTTDWLLTHRDSVFIRKRNADAGFLFHGGLGALTL